MTEIEANKVFAVLCALFPSAKVEPCEKRGGGTRGAYARMLADLEYTPACAAVERVAATHTYPTVLPAIAEIRAAYAELTRGDVRAGGDAWGDVITAIRRFGVHRRPRFDDPLVADAVRSLGWENLCNSENAVADRSQFVALYDKLAAVARRDEVTSSLPAAKRLREAQSAVQLDGMAGDLAKLLTSEGRIGKGA